MELILIALIVLCRIDALIHVTVGDADCPGRRHRSLGENPPRTISRVAFFGCPLKSENRTECHEDVGGTARMR